MYTSPVILQICVYSKQHYSDYIISSLSIKTENWYLLLQAIYWNTNRGNNKKIIDITNICPQPVQGSRLHTNPLSPYKLFCSQFNK